MKIIFIVLLIFVSATVFSHKSSTVVIVDYVPDRTAVTVNCNNWGETTIAKTGHITDHIGWDNACYPLTIKYKNKVIFNEDNYLADLNCVKAYGVSQNTEQQIVVNRIQNDCEPK